MSPNNKAAVRRHLGTRLDRRRHSGDLRPAPDDRLIPTSSGWRDVGDISVGDQVFGADGVPASVTAVEHHTGPLYRITYSDGASVTTFADEIWLLEHRYGKYRDWAQIEVTADEAIDLGVVRPNSNERRFQATMPHPVQYLAASVELDSYSVGAIVSNGGTTSCSVQVSAPEPDVRERLAGLGGTVINDKTPGVCPRLTMRGHMRPIRKLGLNVRSRQKFLPEPYLRGSVEQRISLLHGLMDGDGTGSAGARSCVGYSTTSLRLLHDLVELVNSLGGTCNPGRQDRTHHGKGIEYSASIMLPDDISPFFTKAKQRGATTNRTRPRRAIEAIEPIGEGTVTRLVVDSPDGQYLVGRQYVVVPSARPG